MKRTEAFENRHGEFVVAYREGEEAIGGDCTEWVASDTTVPIKR